MKIKVNNIVWDTGKKRVKLPKSATIEIDDTFRRQHIYTPIATRLSDKFDYYFFKAFDYDVIGDHEEERVAELKKEIKRLKKELEAAKRTTKNLKLYTAAICLKDITGKNGEDDFYTEAFASQDERDKWLDDMYVKMTNEALGEEDEDYTIIRTFGEKVPAAPNLS